MDITELSIDELKAELKSYDITLHHKTGIDKLRSTLQAAIDGTYEAKAPEPKPVVVKEAKVKVLTKEEQLARMTKEERALRLVRIVVSPNDPNMSSYNGLIFTVGSSSVNKGRMIKKYVPFNNENGWHVPHIIYQQIENAEMQKFKTVKLPNGEKTLQAYITKKFNVQVLPDLTPAELSALAAAQKARGDA